MLPKVIIRGGKVNDEGEGILAGGILAEVASPSPGPCPHQGHVLVGSAGSVSSVPGKILALVLSGQQLLSSLGQWLVPGVLYGPTPNCVVLHPTALSCIPPCGPVPHHVVLHPAACLHTLLHGPVPNHSILHPCAVLHPTTRSGTPSHDPAPHHVVLQPMA